MSDVEFKPWPKIPRYKGLNVTITEKIDGTNGCLVINEGRLVGVQSRNVMLASIDDNGFLVRNSDNYGFAHWAMGKYDVLPSVLSDGYHYGEWAGPGIQGNKLNLPEKFFFLFNAVRWGKEPILSAGINLDVVPLLYEGVWDGMDIEGVMAELWDRRIRMGQIPEGIIVYFNDLHTSMKYTFEHQEGKWANG